MNDLLRNSKMFLTRNAPTILTGIGAVGVVATSVLAVKSTPKALRLLEEAEQEKGEKLTKFEAVKVAGPVYIPSVLVGASTIACIVGANVLNKHHQAALTSAYALLDNSYKEYRKKVEELYGKEVDERVKEEIAKDKYDENDISVDGKKHLFYDDFSGRYFESTTENVLRAENYINRQISVWGGTYLNEFYEQLGIPTTDYGDYLGWSAGGLMEMTWEQWLDFDHKKVIMDDGLECFIITMSTEPMFDYEYY